MVLPWLLNDVCSNWQSNLDEFCVAGKMSQDSEGSEYPQIIHAQAGITW